MTLLAGLNGSTTLSSCMDPGVIMHSSWWLQWIFNFHPWQIFIYIYIYIYIKECIYIYKYKYICICIYIFQMCSYSPWLMEAIFRFVSEFSHVDKKVTGFWPRRRALVWWSSWNENPGSFHWSNEMGMLPIQWGCFPSFKEKQGTHYLEKHQMMFFKSKMKQLNNNDHQRFPGKN